MRACSALVMRWACGLLALAGAAGWAQAAAPHAGDAPPAAAATHGLPATPGHAASAARAPRPALVDVNSATRAQLKRLPGIGDAEAERIVAGRPYLSKADLVTRRALPAGVFQSIRHQIIAVQKAPNQPRLRRTAPTTAGTHPKG